MKKIASIIMTMVMALFLAVGVSGASVKAASISSDGSGVVLDPGKTLYIENLTGNSMTIHYDDYTYSNTAFTLDIVTHTPTTSILTKNSASLPDSFQVSANKYCVVTNNGTVPVIFTPYAGTTKLDISSINYFQCVSTAFDTVTLQPGENYSMNCDVKVSDPTHSWVTATYSSGSVVEHYATAPMVPMSIYSSVVITNLTPSGGTDEAVDVYVPNAPVEYVEPVDYSIVHPGGTVTFTNVDSTNTTFKCFDVSGANSVIDVDYVNYKPSGSVSLIERYSKTQPYSILTAGYYCVLTNNSSFDIVIKAYKTINGTPTEVSDKTKYNFASKTGPAFNVYSLQPGDTLDVTNAVMVTNRAHCLVTYTPNSGSPTVSYATTDMISLSAWKSVVILNDGTDPFDVYVPVE